MHTLIICSVIDIQLYTMVILINQVITITCLFMHAHMWYMHMERPVYINIFVQEEELCETP